MLGGEIYLVTIEPDSAANTNSEIISEVSLPFEP